MINKKTVGKPIYRIQILLIRLYLLYIISYKFWKNILINNKLYFKKINM